MAEDATDVGELNSAQLEESELESAKTLEPPAPPEESGRRTRRSRKSRSAHREPEAKAAGDTQVEELTEREVVNAFWYAYRLICLVLGSPAEARVGEFSTFGRAWMPLLKQVPGIKLVITGFAPLVTLMELFERFEAAWEKRRRFRAKPRTASVVEPPPQPSDSELRVMHGGPGAP